MNSLAQGDLDPSAYRSQFMNSMTVALTWFEAIQIQ